jgi:hypothetical protein
MIMLSIPDFQIGYSFFVNLLKVFKKKKNLEEDYKMQASFYWDWGADLRIKMQK